MEDFVTFEIAVKLKEKGFREKVNAYYGKYENIFNIHPALDMNDADYRASAPTISQVLKWLRKEKKIICLPHIEPFKENWFFYVVILPQPSDFPEYMYSINYNTYEQAALAGIGYVLDNLI